MRFSSCLSRSMAGRFAADSALEGDGFELPVPRQISSSFKASSEMGPIDRRRLSVIRAVAGQPDEMRPDGSRAASSGCANGHVSSTPHALSPAYVTGARPY
jgi:hypothetical protein